MKKSTIYIDIEDDIAGIADKIKASNEKIVALVLPKRPSVLQGSVNVNLLKRISEQASKNIVLITTDEQVMTLAAQAGLYVSSSLQSKPAIPKVKISKEEIEESVEDDGVDPAQPDVYVGDKKVDLSTPIGKLAGADEGDDDEIELDNLDQDDEKKEEDSKKESKGIKVPNFGSFRIRLVLAGLVIILLSAIGYWAFMIAPKASITIDTQKSDANSKITVIADTAQQAVDSVNMLVPAKKLEDKQTLSGSFTPTGQKDVGDKASGTVTLKNCDSTDPVTIPSGTGVSKGSYTFITQKAATLPGGSFSGGGSNCTTPDSSAVDVAVIASKPGDQYNLAAGSYTVAGYGNITAYGSVMGGGTSKIVKVVSADDIEAAKLKLLENAADNVQGKVATLLTNDGYIPIADTYSTSQGEPKPAVAVDGEASGDVAITMDITSSMLGVKRQDVDPLLSAEITKNITSAQTVSSTGSESAVVGVIEKTSPEKLKISISATGKVGPNLNEESLKTQIAGARAGAAKQQLETLPGVTKADIRLSPFWVFSIPKKTTKITITING